MKNKMKKLLSVTLAVIMALSVFAVGASAWWWNDEDEETYLYEEIFLDNVIYLIDSEFMTATVTDYETDDEGNSLLGAEVVIPESVSYEGDSYTVDTICYGAFDSCPTIKKVTIPETVTYIDDYAFCDASYLEAIVIPETTEFEYFGSHVFDGTPVLGYLAENSADGAIILGKNVLYAYVGTENSYTVPEEITTIADSCFFLSGAEEIILNDNITEIREFTFSNCRNLKEITVPEAVEYIGEGAFSNCISLGKVNIGDAVYAIGTKAFENTKIKELYLGDSLEGLVGAFAGCSTLENFTISENSNFYMDGDALCYRYEYTDEHMEEEFPDDFPVAFDTIEYFIITSDEISYTVPEKISGISSYAFYNNKQIKEVILTSPIDIYSEAFEYSGVERIDFSKITNVGCNAFRGCKGIKSADLSNACLIDDSSFENCTSLEEVTLGDALYYIGSLAFANTALTTVDIVGAYTAVCEGTFKGCPELTRINFNSNVNYIDSYIASYCPKLERVYISDTVTYVDENAFAYNDGIVFEVIKYSDGYDFVEEMGYEYEIVGKLSFFERLSRFFTNLFNEIMDWFFRW